MSELGEINTRLSRMEGRIDQVISDHERRLNEAEECRRSCNRTTGLVGGGSAGVIVALIEGVKYLVKG